MLASKTRLPVIGVPIPTEPLGGLDSLLSIVQMPRGVPVATVAIGNAENAALAGGSRILALPDPELAARLAATGRAMRQAVLDDPSNRGGDDRARVGGPSWASRAESARRLAGGRPGPLWRDGRRRYNRACRSSIARPVRESTSRRASRDCRRDRCPRRGQRHSSAHYINLSVIALICGTVAISALELGVGVGSPLVKLCVLIGGPILIVTTADAGLRIWRSAWAWMPVNRGRGLFRLAWVGMTVVLPRDPRDRDCLPRAIVRPPRWLARPRSRRPVDGDRLAAGHARPGSPPASTTARAAAPGSTSGRFRVRIGERLVCPSCGLIAYVNPRLVVTTLPVIARRRGPAHPPRHRAGRGLWAQPGGFLEVDETVQRGGDPRDLEETGLVVEPGEIIGLYSRLEASVVGDRVRGAGSPAAGGRPADGRGDRDPGHSPPERSHGTGSGLQDDVLLRSSTGSPDDDPIFAPAPQPACAPLGGLTRWAVEWGQVGRRASVPGST